MQEQQNLEIIRRGYDAFARGDITGLLELFADEIEWKTPGPQDLPTAGTRRGREQVGQFFGTLDQVFEIQRFEPQTFLADGDRVVVLGSETSRVKATGAVISSDWTHAFRVRDGKVVEFQEYMDTAAAVAELRAAQAKA
jgi:ketosteroid isomerase-like protein